LLLLGRLELANTQRRYLNQTKRFSEVHTEAKILEAGRWPTREAAREERRRADESVLREGL
jgi:hypothetical protein